MLVAYAIANAPGFRPSAAFKSNPDYELVARWYEEIQPKTADVVVGLRRTRNRLASLGRCMVGSSRVISLQWTRCGRPSRRAIVNSARQ